MIKITETAKMYLESKCKSNDSKYIKISVQGGGCAGFSYHYEFCDSFDPLDFKIDLEDGYGFILDSMSFLYLAGTTIDYVSDIAGSSLKIINPNEASSCGCGKSFSI